MLPTRPSLNARILIERDAFSGEGSTDEDSNTYWIPIASVDTDDRGDWSAIVPAGKMRITAYAGESDPTLERTRLTSGTQYTDFLDLNQPRDGDASSPHQSDHSLARQRLRHDLDRDHGDHRHGRGGGA